MHYELTTPFTNDRAGTVLKRISVDGEDHVEAWKLKALNQDGVDIKRLNVTEKDLDELFVKTNVSIA